MLIDRAEIQVKAGDGGDGSASFRREKYIPKGGPDGGDGGDGGDIYLVVDANAHGLRQFRHQKEYKAVSGERGLSKKKTGKSGDDLLITVPPGTQVYTLEKSQTLNNKSQDNAELTADLTTQGERFLLAKGGKGGLGNCHFMSSTHQSPREFTKGTKGEEKYIRLELKLIADVGLIGLPNVGKSTLLAHITQAKPEIADYPFTTLEPNLGVLDPKRAGLGDGDWPPIVFADIPGLIAGASAGKGLGHEFLRHIERTQVLVHLVDALSSDPEADYLSIRSELSQWSKQLPPLGKHLTGGTRKVLTDKPEVVVVNRIDAQPDFATTHPQFMKQHKPLLISAVSGAGIPGLITAIVKLSS